VGAARQVSKVALPAIGQLDSVLFVVGDAHSSEIFGFID
jgi:hypothetical protein